MPKRKSAPLAPYAPGEIHGDRLRARRLALNLSQFDLTRTSGVPQKTISPMETGKRRHAFAFVAFNLARALNTSIDYLLGGTDDPSPPRPPRKRG